MPVSDPPIFWSSYFLLWFAFGFFGILWAGNDDTRQGIIAILAGILFLGIIISAQFSNAMFIVLEANGGLFAGYGCAVAAYVIKRIIDRLRGLPPQNVRPILNVEKDGLRFATMSVLMGTYLWAAWSFGFWRDFNSIWWWIGMVLVGLWFLSAIWFINKYRR